MNTGMKRQHSFLYLQSIYSGHFTYCMVIFQKEKLESGFSLDRLRSLLKVHEAGYIAKAAGGDTTRANQISRQISELEEFFGAKLRHKEGRQAVLTKEGDELALLAKSFLRGLERFQDRVDGRPETINLGTGNTIIDTVLIPSLEEIREEAGGAMIMLRNRRSGEVIDQLLSDELDLGIVSETRIPSGMETAKLAQVSFDLYVPHELKHMAEGRKPLQVMNELPYASLDGSGETKTAISEAAAKQDIHLRPELECSGSGQVASAIESGNYCGVLPSLFSRYFDKEQVIRMAIPGLARLKRKYVVAWQPSTMKVREKPLRGAIRKIKEVFKETVKPS